TSKFLSIIVFNDGSYSIKQHDPAPRLSASIPRLPVPAQMSSTRIFAKSMRLARILKRASLTRSDVGLVVTPGGADNFLPRQVPDMTRIQTTLARIFQGEASANSLIGQARRVSPDGTGRNCTKQNPGWAGVMFCCFRRS